MRTILFAIVMLFTLSASAQSYTIKGNQIVAVQKDKKESSITTDMTYNHNGQVCKVKLSKNGRADVSKALCKKYGVTYKKTR